MFDPAPVIVTAPATVRDNTADILRRARALIESPERWTQNVLARSKDGQEITYEYLPSDDAVRFCASGAVCQTTANRLEHEAAWLLLGKAMGMQIAFYNDMHNRSHSDILAVFDRAIALAEKEARQ